ncbi:LysR family transcriptional regulator [Lactobacillaceae bacterium Scapto_B20]
MNTRDLEYFINLTQIKNFSKVAHKFNVSQPTITFALQRLERELDSKLIIRHRTHELVVTDSGKQFLLHANAILDHYRLAKAELNNLKDTKLVLGLPPVIENHYFAKLSAKLKQTGLLNKIETIESGSEATLNALKNGEIDLALMGSIDPLVETTLTAEEFDRRPFAVYVADDHPLADRDGVYFSDLKNEDFILFKNGFIHNTAFNKMVKRNHFHPNVIFRSNEIHSIMKMIEANVGIGFFSTLIPNSYDKINKLTLLDHDVPQFVTSIVYRRSHRFSGLQLEILNQIRSALVSSHD